MMRMSWLNWYLDWYAISAHLRFWIPRHILNVLKRLRNPSFIYGFSAYCSSLHDAVHGAYDVLVGAPIDAQPNSIGPPGL